MLNEIGANLNTGEMLRLISNSRLDVLQFRCRLCWLYLINLRLMSKRRERGGDNVACIIMCFAYLNAYIFAYLNALSRFECRQHVPLNLRFFGGYKLLHLCMSVGTFRGLSSQRYNLRERTIKVGKPNFFYIHWLLISTIIMKLAIYPSAINSLWDIIIATNFIFFV